MDRIRILGLTSSIGVVVVLVLASMVGAHDLSQVPPPAPPWVNPTTGVVINELVPAFIPVGDSSGAIVGFVRSEDAFFKDTNAPAPVYATETGGAVVGCLNDEYVPAAC